jgi:hypothetical protein
MLLGHQTGKTVAGLVELDADALAHLKQIDIGAARLGIDVEHKPAA